MGACAPLSRPQEGSERTYSVPRDLLIRTTGVEATCGANGRWIQLDPVWAPDVPACLLSESWLLWTKVSLPKIGWDVDSETEVPLLSLVERPCANSDCSCTHACVHGMVVY